MSGAYTTRYEPRVQAAMAERDRRSVLTRGGLEKEIIHAVNLLLVRQHVPGFPKLVEGVVHRELRAYLPMPTPRVATAWIEHGRRVEDGRLIRMGQILWVEVTFPNDLPIKLRFGL